MEPSVPIPPDGHPSGLPVVIRVDKWLKVTRIFKTRTQAGQACEEGRVRVNGAGAKPAKLVKTGDRILVKAHHFERELEVLGITRKSVSAAEARTLYREEARGADPGDALPFLDLGGPIRDRFPKYSGRPTKKTRRQLEKLRGH